MRAFGLSLILGLAIGAPLPPQRLLCDGSAFSDKYDPSTSFAVRHDRRVRFTWEPVSDTDGATQSGYRVVVRGDGEEVAWDSGVVGSGAPEAVYAGAALKPGTLYTWEVRWADQSKALSEASVASFRTGLAGADWNGVAWIGSNTTNLFRAEFNTPSFAKATLYLCGLGYSTTTLNGANISSGHLVSAPWTPNERLVMYSTYDVTALLKQNAVNSVGVALGLGWRDTSAFTRHEDTTGDGTERVLRAILQITSSSGNTTSVLTTSSSGWTTASGPVVMDSVYNGETYDARKEIPGWDLVGFSGQWGAAQVVAEGPRGTMVPWSAPQVAVSRVLKALSVTNPQPGVQVVDFGINQAGVVRVTGINLPAGKSLTLRHGEILQHPGLPGNKYEPGMIYTANLRGAKATDVYISNGKVGEFFPQFTYHGFRFVEVTGMNITADQIEMHHFHSMVQQKTQVNLSSPLLNSIQTLALGAQRSNMMSVLTDCDQRDERLGWMGDADLSSNSIALNYDAASFLKFCADIDTVEVDSDGSLPDVVPWYRYGGRPADVSWSAAFPQIQYVNWKMNNDVEGIREHLDHLVMHQKNIAGQAAGGLAKMHTSYGDWVPPPAKEGGGNGPKPSSPYTSAFSYIVITQIVGEMAGAVGNTTVESYMANQVVELKKQFNEAFYKNGQYDVNLQTDNSLALALGGGMDTATAAQELYKSVVAKDHHFDTGIIGFKFLFDGLHDNGHASDALAVLEGTTYPSIGYMLTNTLEPASENLWELTDAPFEGTGMNSRNHHMWSSYSEYLVQRVAGADVSRGVLSPAAADVDLASADVTMQQSNGMLRFKWTKEGGVQCRKGYKGAVHDAHANRVELECGAGGVVEEVLFASYGDAKGTTCGSYEATTGCDHPDSMKAARAACLGRARCALDLTQFSASGLPATCSGNPHMRMAVRCSNKAVTRVEVEVPIGSELALHTSGRALFTSEGKSLATQEGDLFTLPTGRSSYSM